jgi:hypothetical protein
MFNVHLELEKLRHTLRAKGLDDDTVSKIVRKAETEINLALRDQMDNAMDLAVQSGVQKRSPEFINDLRPRPDAFELTTESSITDFSDPPYPMLDRLLASGAKPMADGSGVYKIIPVGGNNKPRPPIYTNIFDAQKAIMAERHESAAKQYAKVAPRESKFRTATSKQSRATAWVQPATQKDFTEDLSAINTLLSDAHDNIVNDIIRSYEEGF